MELKDTVALMLSEDYRERFVAEYSQLAIRYKGLRKILQKLDDGTLEFTPTCDKLTLRCQLETMSEYLKVLQYRARDEKIAIPEKILEGISFEERAQCSPIF